MSTQPEALRLAEWMEDLPTVIPSSDSYEWEKAAFELRRLYEENIDLQKDYDSVVAENTSLEVENNRMADKLKAIAKIMGDDK